MRPRGLSIRGNDNSHVEWLDRGEVREGGHTFQTWGYWIGPRGSVHSLQCPYIALSERKHVSNTLMGKGIVQKEIPTWTKAYLQWHK